MILVGHSFGGTMISKVAEYLPGRIKRLIFLNAFVLDDNQSVYDNLPDALIEVFNQLAQSSPDNRTLLPFPGRSGETISSRMPRKR
jgi:pimeloyl-ACP methyl ester carboxylesterase